MRTQNFNQSNIESLSRVIHDNLDHLIDQDYCLLDIPDHNNIGDNLIWAGELAFLKRTKYKSIYSANLFLCQFDKIPENGLILLHGGGNFGDVWRVLQDFRLRIAKQFPKARIIIFPQTVHYKDENLLKADALEFNKHPNLTICARDRVSFETLKKHFVNNTILLVPDMAFCLDFNDYISQNETRQALYLKRNDRELNNDQKGASILSMIKESHPDHLIDIKDWPTMDEKADHLYRYYFKVDGLISRTLIRVPLLGRLIDHRFGIKRRDNMENYINIGVDFINKYDVLYSTRLHVFILGALLNKPVHILDNSYGKNLNFYNTWLREFKNVTMIS